MFSCFKREQQNVYYILKLWRIEDGSPKPQIQSRFLSVSVTTSHYFSEINFTLRKCTQKLRKTKTEFCHNINDEMFVPK